MTETHRRPVTAPYAPDVTDQGLPVGPVTCRPDDDDPWPGTTVQLVLSDTEAAYDEPGLWDLRP